MKPIIYVSSSVTLASDAYQAFVAKFKQELRSASAAFVLEWVDKNHEINFDDFYKRDFNNVQLCDAMIALVDEPSIGVGMEIQEAIRRKKPLICMFKTGTTVSRLLLSASDSVGLRIETYTTMDEAVSIATGFLANLRNHVVYTSN